MKAVGSTHENGACSVGLSHAGCACAHAVEPRGDERIAMDISLRDLESRRSLHDEDSAVLLDAEKKARSVLDSAEEALSTARERCDAAWTTDAEISAKLCCVLEKAASDLNRRQHVPTAVGEGGRRRAGPQRRHEGSQLCRGSCRAAGGRSLAKSG